MVNLIENEKKILIILSKDFNDYYNANSISKNIGISRIGSMKILKRLWKRGYLVGRIIGKSIVYKLNLEDGYVRDLISFLLSDEANNFKRWKDEFKELYKKERIVMICGSAIRDYSKAKDIDIMVIRKKANLARYTD